jgi:hypothetical protein
MQHHSIARGKYVHGIEIHRVKPDSVEEYKKAAERLPVTTRGAYVNRNGHGRGASLSVWGEVTGIPL